jgi:hypothetical protein
MDPSVVALDTNSVPSPDYHVRRRKCADDVWLIRLNQYYRLDVASDRIWQLCNGTRRIKDIILEYKKATGATLDHSASAVALALQIFCQIEVIEIRDGDFASSDSTP